ncbi:MAG: GNAT family N-acetyltransferase [Anaerolineae bacterium]|nr:GNAT family N-acetyltransferase [Thermoflexales bacterium]MDW8408892.1 GNAT family N-acetyltransferase [Anaerolineae bacterium]
MVYRREPIETDRLVQRSLAMDDAPSLHSEFTHPEAMRFWHMPPHADLSETQAMIARELAGDGCAWTVSRRGDPDAIGLVYYLGNPGPPGLGYILHPAHWGQGYMTEAVRAAVNYGFTILGLDRVELWIDADNVASRRLASRLGFTSRGRFSQKFPHRANVHETFVYGLHVSEWPQPQSEQTDQLLRRAAPANRFYRLEPVLPVPDVRTAAEYYRDRLGFTIDYLYGDPPTHASVSRGEWTTEGARIQFSRAAEGRTALPDGALYVFVGPDIDGLCEQYRAQGVHIESEPATYPWGMREFHIRDCHGYLIRFGAPA